ncbi:CHAT domain-containing protein [candidate division KSB1 bacterium]|nr:CHAT domain-containing protein [candidate division KSB1 bacterium]
MVIFKTFRIRCADWKSWSIILFFAVVHASAIQSIFASVSRADSSRQQQFNRAQQLIGHKRYEEAFAAFNNIIRIDPNFLPAYKKIIFVCQQRGDLKPALEYFEERLRVAPESAGALFGMGAYHAARDEHEIALTYFTKSIRQNPQLLQAYRDLCESYRELERLDEAETYLKSLFAQSPPGAALYVALGIIYQYKRDWKESLKNLDRAIDLNPEFTIAHIEKGTVLFYAGQIQTALDVNQHALELAHKQHQLEEEATILNALGVSLNFQGKLSDVALSYQKATSILKQIGSVEKHYKVQINLGITYTRLGDYPRALTLLKECMLYFRAQNDSTTLATVMGNMGGVYMNQARYDSAWFYIQPAARISERFENFRFASYWNSFLGLIQQNRGNLEDALYHLRRAHQYALKFGNQAYVARNLSAIGRIFFEIGRVDSAVTNYKRALAYLRKAGDVYFEAHCLANLAMAENDAGNFSQGLEYYETAYRIVQQTGDTKDQMNWLGDIGNVHSALGDYDAAIHYFRKALQLSDRLRTPDAQCRLLHNLGENYILCAKYDSAINLLNRALKISRRIEARKSETGILEGLGTSYARLQKWEKAQHYYSRAIELGKKMNNRLIFPPIYISLSRLHRQQGNYPEAKHYAQLALNLANDMNSATSITDANLELGRIFFNLDSLKLARDFFQAAIRSIEAVRDRVPGQEFKISYFETKTRVYNALIRTLVTLHRRDPSAGFAEQAFNVAEQAKSRTMLELLKQSKAKWMKNAPMELLVARRNAEQQLNSAQSALSLEAGKLQPDSMRLDSLWMQLRQSQDTLYQIQAQIERKENGYNTIRNASAPINLRQIQSRILKPEQALLEFSVGSESSYLFIAKKQSLNIFEIPMADSALKTKILQLRRPFVNVKDATDIHFDVHLAHKLYSLLLKPAEAIINPGETLIIVPDGILFYLPFEALVTDLGGNSGDESTLYERYRTSRYLIEKFPIAYSSSASVLDPLLAAAREKASPEHNLLAVGDPSYHNTAPDAMVLRQQRNWLFQPLQYSEQEIEQINREFRQATTMLHRNATEDSIKAIAGEYRLLHFSAHGLLDERQPMYSGLALTQDDDPAEDGFLQSYEIFDLKLNADLVTLSACETGLGALKQGEGIIGLTRAFLYAGCKSVVVSLWSVADASTAELMAHFYRNLNQGMSKADALRQAKLALMRQSVDMGQVRLSYANPFFWAPFVLIGDTEAVEASANQYIYLIWMIVGLAVSIAIWVGRRRRIS